MRVKRLVYAGCGALGLAAAFIASPIVTAWSIREAIRTGDSTYLEKKLEWDTVRLSLRASLTEIATGIPEAHTVSAGAGEIVRAEAPRPGLWQRIKNGLSRRAVDSLIETYVTPTRLPQLFTLRQFYRDNVSGETAELETMPWTERVAGFWSRIRRAEFHAPTVFELEMADRNDPSRRYIGLMRLRGLEWKLTELRLRVVPAAGPA